AHPDDPRMGVRRAQERRVELSGQDDVGDEARLPAQEPRILPSTHRRPEVLRAHYYLFPATVAEAGGVGATGGGAPRPATGGRIALGVTLAGGEDPAQPGGQDGDEEAGNGHSADETEDAEED